MTIAAVSGPLVTFRDGVADPNAGTVVNPETGPSVFDQGFMLLDPRAPFTYVPGNAPGAPCRGFLGNDFLILDQTPAAATNTNIAAAQAASIAALTLSTASVTGITPGVTIVNSLTGANVTNVTAIDSSMSAVAFGQSGSVQAWDPTKSVSRNISIIAVGGNNSGVTFLVSGYDLYSYPLTESIAGSTSGVAIVGKKAFKYVSGITITAGTVGSGVSVGTGTLVGLPLRADNAGYVSVYGQTSGAWMTTGSTITTAVTSTANATTGDVRGTISTLGTGTSAMQIYQTVTVANVSSNAGLFGVTQA